MKKNLFIVFCFVGILSIVFLLESDTKKGKMSKILLANIEALASDEGGGKSESKESKTKQAGPYLVTIRGEEQYAYLVTTVTNCFGIGVVECEPDTESQWVPVK